MSTIVAISTAPVIGGIGIVRISGDKSFEILEKILHTIQAIHRFKYKDYPNFPPIFLTNEIIFERRYFD